MSTDPKQIKYVKEDDSTLPLWARETLRLLDERPVTAIERLQAKWRKKRLTREVHADDCDLVLLGNECSCGSTRLKKL